MDEEEDLSPFWVPSTRRHHHRRRSSPIFLNTGFLLILLLATSLVLIFIVVPAIVSFTSSIFRPQLVKKSWDSLNLVLVLFAIICGFLSRNTTNNSNNNNYEDTPRSNVSSNTRSQWYGSGDEYSDQTVYGGFKNSSFNRLRSSSSYPDLRVENQWPAYTYQDERVRFYDDTRLHGYGSFGSGSGHRDVHHAVRLGEERDDEKFETKSTIVEEVVVKGMVAPPVEVDSQPSAPVDHVVSRRKPSGSYEDFSMKADEEVLHTADESRGSSSVPVSTQQAVRRRRTKSESEIFLPPEETVMPPPAPAEEPIASTRKPTRTYEAVPRKPRSEMETLRPPSPPPYVEAPPPSRSERRRRPKRMHESQVPETVATPAAAPPPPLPTEGFYGNWEEKSEKHEKKRSGSATKEFLNSLRRRKKKQRQKSIESFESLFVSQPSPSSSSSQFLYPPPSPPPPPPPPPPPCRVHSIFSSKKGKNKKSHSNPPPPPPPPPRMAPPTKNVVTIKKPTLPSQPRISDTNINTGGQSPLIPIPPPPPPPPFKVPEWRYKVRGGFIRINSNDTSRSSSPDIEEEDNDDESGPFSTKESAPQSPVVEPNTPISCPSPDVNTKADDFIAKFRAGLKLEKMNSIKQKRPGRSNLGLGPGSPKLD